MPTSDDERAVLRLMQLSPRVTYVDVSTVMGFSESKTYRLVQSLRKKGAIRRVGSRKSGHWEVLE